MLTDVPTDFEPSLTDRIQRNIPYCSIEDGTSLLMDIYYPNQRQEPCPVVVYVHGGSWESGDKSEAQNIFRPTELVRGGNVFVSVNYRLAPDYRFPASIEDVKCAVRWLRAHAESMGIDPQRIAAMGSSAGGHLVTLLGTAGPEAGWDQIGGYSEQSSQVQAVVDLFGPAAPTGVISDVDISLLQEVFGARDINDPVLQRASPLNYISADAPPFMIIHGTEDTTVPLEQSTLLAERLRSAGVPTELIVVKGAGHGLSGWDGKTQPSYYEVLYAIQKFLTTSLRGSY